MKVGLIVGSILWLWALPATLATAAVLLLVLITGGNWPWFVWLLASPMLYVIWVVGFLFFAGRMMRRMGGRHPKPRRAVIPSEDRGLRTVRVCSLRLHLVKSLPLVPAIQLLPWGRTLVMKAYAPSVHVGTDVQIAGTLTDPDLTVVEDSVFIGRDSVIAAHTWGTSPSGKPVYVTSPVKIGKGAMIGAGCAVPLGCTIGEYAVIQTGSFLLPHTQIPPYEVWGGNPATFQRKRPSGTQAAAADVSREESSPVT
jgi:carbonic anhydrase/acetyltransferase-like protein (isoleucine patch superfamily)